jgi:hypothetical protein
MSAEGNRSGSAIQSASERIGKITPRARRGTPVSSHGDLMIGKLRDFRIVGCDRIKI